MSVLTLDNTTGPVSVSEATRQIKENLRDAREKRKTMEPVWHDNLAYAAGKFWLKWDRNQRRLVFPPEFFNKDLYAADVITEYRMTALGELGSDDDRPALLLRRDDQASEDYQSQLNRALAWGWDYEWRGDEALEEARRLCVDLGTSAIRCRFDPAVGPVLADSVPYQNGKPVLDMGQATELLGNGPSADVSMRPIQRGSIRWEPLSPFNLLVPPGIPHERDFPWECVIRPVPLAAAKAQYGSLLADAREDMDIGSILGLEVSAEASGSVGRGPDTKTGRVRGHIWLFTYYERATPMFPSGRTVTFATNKMTPVAIELSLPYQGPSGDYRSGITYFHWWRVSGRFWSRALVENMKDVQRSVNKRRTQINEIIDRGLPYVIVETNSKAKERRGLAVEMIEVDRDERPPQPVSGVSPGEWMYRDVEAMREDLEHATGLRGPRLGENPIGVTTYAQLALLNENDQTKRQMILRQHKGAVAELVESSVYDMRTYWGDSRQIALAGDEDQVDAHIFDATKIPPFFIVKVAKGVAAPRSQAAELKKIEDIFSGAINTQAAIQDAHAWLHWLRESYDAGQARDLPDATSDDQVDKARIENHLMLQGGRVGVRYYDPPDVHIPIHREAQIQAEYAGDAAIYQLIEDHVQEHLQVAAQAAQQAMQQQAALGPSPPAGPGAPGPGGSSSLSPPGPPSQPGPQPGPPGPPGV